MKITFSHQPPTAKAIALIEVVKNLEETKVVTLASGQKVIQLAIKEPKKINHRQLITLIRQLAVLAKVNKIKAIALKIADLSLPHLKISDLELGQLIAQESVLADFEFNHYKTKPAKGWDRLEQLILVGQANSAFKNGVKQGLIIAEQVNAARVLANTPGGLMTPTVLAAAAKQSANKTKVKVTVLDVAQMKKLKMNAILGVAQGSPEKPKFIIIEYWGAGKNHQPIVLVGKGVTFDTGGLNIKTGDGMLEMHMDMSGGAAVIHAIIAAAKLNLKKNVIALIPSVENTTSGSAFRPGDILRSMSGATIEVLNTDAEGRVILADALTYAKKYQPKLVVDVATLTGAALAAIGQRASIICTKEYKLEQLFRELGELSGDYVWPLPIWEEYEAEIKGTFGDWSNLGKSRYGGAITAAMFLYQFAKDYPWVHIDMAPRMVSIEGDNLAKGATGEPVRLLVKLLEQY